MSWLPETLPQRVESGDLVFVPLTPALVEPDYFAVMRDVALLRAWSGQDWPTDSFPLADNLVDLQRHEREQLAGVALTYSVLIDGTVQGCIYVRPMATAFQGRSVQFSPDVALPPEDVVVRGWLHDRPATALIAATVKWLSVAPFTFPRLWWQTNSQYPEQVVACDQLGLTDSLGVAGSNRTWILRAAPSD